MDKTVYCDFCGKSQHEVKHIFAGPSVFICGECVAACKEIVKEEEIPGASQLFCCACGSSSRAE